MLRDTRIVKLVIFGLTVTSSWGNGHAALWRALIAALHADGHTVTFFERNTPYYAAHRDVRALPGGGTLVLYETWDADIVRRAAAAADAADAAIVTSYCPDAGAAGAVLANSRVGLRCFYDLDTPVTLARLAAGLPVDYAGAGGYADYDLVLSYTGGPALSALRTRLGARRVAPLYGSVDPSTHRPGDYTARFGAALSYIGTYAADRQPAVEALFVGPARARADLRFMLAGAQYPDDFPWTSNIYFVRHLPVRDHPAFYASSRVTLNVTRAAMAGMGWCPSGRLFEAAACGSAIVSDDWPGLADFFTPGEEILVARNTPEMLDVLAMPDAELQAIGQRARERALAEHTAARRAREMVALLSSCAGAHAMARSGEAAGAVPWPAVL